MTSVGGGEEAPEVECCADVSINSAITSVGRRITTVKARLVDWVFSCTAQLRDAVEDRRLNLDDGGCPGAASHLVEATRPALTGCRQVIRRRLTDACGSCRPGTTRLRESLTFWRAVVAEFVGTFFIVVIGCGSATEHRSYTAAQQLQQDRAVRMALAFGNCHETTLFAEKTNN